MTMSYDLTHKPFQDAAALTVPVKQVPHDGLPRALGHKVIRCKLPLCQSRRPVAWNEHLVQGSMLSHELCQRLLPLSALARLQGKHAV